MSVITSDADQGLLAITGDLTAGRSEEQLLEEVRGLLASGCTSITIDLSAVGFVDSSGLGALVRSYSACATEGGRLVLRAVSPQLQSLLKIARLDDVFVIEGND